MYVRLVRHIIGPEVRVIARNVTTTFRRLPEVDIRVSWRLQTKRHCPHVCV